MKTQLIALLFLINVNFCFSQEPNLQIQYQVAIDNTEIGEGEVIESGSTPKSSSSELTINLHNNGTYSTSKENGSTTLFDLNKEYIYTYNSDTLFNVRPLYSVIDYRVSEYKNRTFLADMLKESGAGNAFGNLANLESIFGIEESKNKIRKSISSKSDDGTTAYSYKGNELVRVKYSNEKVPKAYMESFSKFLTYSIDMHPSIKEEIIKTNLIPQNITYHYSNIPFNTTKTLTLIEFKSVSLIQQKFNETNRVLDKRDAATIVGTIDSMTFYTMFNKPNPIDSSSVFSKAMNLTDANENLSGILHLLEYLLSTGKQPIDQIKQIAPKADSDTLLSGFLFCLSSPTSKEDAELKISLLNTLIDQNKEFGYVMNIFCANYIEQIDDYEAINYFYKALSHNPNITGAWLDLGKIFANRYNFDDAWKCYDIMLKLKPDHPMAQEIKMNKQSFKEIYPSYFK